MSATDAALYAASIAAAAVTLYALASNGTWRQSPSFVCFLIWLLVSEGATLGSGGPSWMPEVFVLRQVASKGLIVVVVLAIARDTITNVSRRQWRAATRAALIPLVATFVMVLVATSGNGASWYVKQYRALALFGAGTVGLAAVAWLTILWWKIPTHPVREAILAAVTVYPLVQSAALVAYEWSFPLGDALQRVASAAFVISLIWVGVVARRHPRWRWAGPGPGAGR